ncbi:type I restriction endonuclease subunit R [Halobacteriota archaeon]
MSDIPLFKEDHISQIPALQLLINMGYEYLTPEEALKERCGKRSNIILEGILAKQLQEMEINDIEYKGHKYKFSSSNIFGAIDAVKNIRYDGLVQTNENIYDLLSLGKSFEETFFGNSRSYTLNYIDWDKIENNVFHVTEEFYVETADGKSTRRPDIVLFVNGIPFAVIECKRPDIKEPMEGAISQHIRNQKEEHIPRLFIYPQLLMSISKNEAMVGTVSTARKWWGVWKEKEDYQNFEDEILSLINKPLPVDVKDKLFSERFEYVREHFDSMEEIRLITEQDKAVYALCRKKRLMELAHRFIVFDAGYKKIARYQQYYAVNKTLERIKHFERSDKRQGGVIWHTQGSGKSLLMVMLAKSIAIDPDISNPRIVIVTDRINLDDQIYDTFKHCGKEPIQAKTGFHLLGLLENQKNTIITTVLDKFEAAVNKRIPKIDAKNIFVLVDESHRSQYGISNAMMERILPNACYIGFTGTPLMKKEKNTAQKFGGFIDKYTIDQAIKDKAVVRLLYEGRHVVQDVSKKSIDLWFDRVCKPLTEEQKADLKRKFSRTEKLNQTDQKICMMAYDINEHFKNNWEGTGFKGQIATPSKVAALKFKKFLDEIGEVSSEVLISSPDTREGYDDVFNAPSDEVQKFWKSMMDRFGDEKTYNREIKDAFVNHNEPELIIVVEKLLTGFDAPRNTVLYLAKTLKEHSLLQAIARVNRVYDGKDYGYIIDYNGILKELDEALSTYSALEDFDEEDLTGTVVSVVEEVRTLSQKHSDLWEIFKKITNKRDEEEYERLLADKELRQLFYDRLSDFSRTLGIALSTSWFYDEVDDAQIQRYKEELKFFQKLRASVKRRYAETIDYKEYEPKIKKLLDTYVTSDEVVKITELVDIFEKEKFEEELARAKGHAARADMIAHRTMRTIGEKMDEDPVYYKKFSKLLTQAIEEYRLGRLEEAAYYHTVKGYMESILDRKGDDIPEDLEGHEVAKAFYGVVLDVLSESHKEKSELKAISAEIGLGIDKIIHKNTQVDWQRKEEVQNKMLNEIDDYLLDHPDIDMTLDDLDLIMERIMKIAKIRYAQ